MDPRTLVMLLALAGSQLHAQNFVLDPSFGTNGVAYQPGPEPYSGASPLVMETLPDGGFLSLHSAGVDAIKVMRCTPNGKPDSSFAINGHFILAPPSIGLIPSGMVVRPDGKIIITATGLFQGTNDPKIFICQLLPNGVPDPSFGVDGVLYYNMPVYQILRDAVLQTDGKILVAGGSSGSMFVSRFLPNGDLDLSFATNGIGLYNPPGVTASAKTIALGPDGSIYVGGFKSIGADASAWVVAKAAPNGVLDPSFGDGGIFFLDHVPDQSTMSNKPECIMDLMVLDDGSLIAGGYVALSDTWERLAIMKLDAFGQAVHEFGDNGRIYAGTLPEGRYLGKELVYDPTGLFILVGSMLTLDNRKEVVILAFDGMGTVLDQNGSNAPFQFQPEVQMQLTTCGTFDLQGRLIVAVSHWNQPEGRSSFIAFNFDINVGSNEFPENSIGLSAWPNPTSGQLSISYDLQAASKVSVDLLDVSGRTVERSLTNAHRSSGAQLEHLSLDPSLSSGTYHLRVRTGAGSWTRTVVIDR